MSSPSMEGTQLHKRIAENALAELDREKSGYFSDVITRLSQDLRTEAFPNLVFTTLKETMTLLPLYLKQEEFIQLLFQFVTDNRQALQNKMFSRAYIDDPASMRQVTGGFVNAVTERCMELYREGAIEVPEESVQKFTFPYRAEDVVDPDDDEALAELDERPPYEGEERRQR